MIRWRAPKFAHDKIEYHVNDKVEVRTYIENYPHLVWVPADIKIIRGKQHFGSFISSLPDDLYYVDYSGVKDDEIVAHDLLRPKVFTRPLKPTDFMVKSIKVSKDFQLSPQYENKWDLFTE
jgi:hypothetical protein